ncbi:MAG: hypothetical protein IMZ53_16150, partial [Thermoplasmata archaeon]|nr:hypothetical protein [Thermoplasmata archaeon]
MNTDIEIRYKNKDYGFMLAKDPQTQKRLWKVTDTNILPPMYVTDKPQGAQTPQKAYDFTNQNWFYKGCGQTDLYDMYEYYTAGTTDARRKGAVLCGPKYAQATITGVYTITNTPANPGFETGDTTGWTVSAGTLTATNGAAHTGTWSAQTGANSAAYQDLTWDAHLQGKYITITCWSYHAGASNRTLTLDDGVGTATSVKGGAGAWEQHTITRKLDAAATRLRIQLSDVLGSAIWDDFTCTSLTATPTTKFVDFNGYHYAAVGTQLIKWDGTDWDYVYNAPATISDLAVYPVSGTNYLFIGQGYANKWYYTSDCVTFTVSTVANANAQFFAVCGETLWFNSSAYQVRASTNPINGGAVSVVTDIRHSAKVITSLPDHDSRTYVGTTDGFYELDAAGDVNDVVPVIRQESGTITCKYAADWKGMMYVPTALSSLYELSPADGIVTTISPSLAAPGISDFSDNIYGMSGDSNYFYAVLKNTTAIELIAGHWETINDTTEWNWHHIGTIAAVTCECVFISSYSSVKRLWIGCTDGTIYYFHHPTQYGDYSTDTNYRMRTAGDFETSWAFGQYQYNLKDFYSITVHCDNISATKYLTVSYKREYDAAFTALGTITSSYDNTLFFPSGIVTRKLQLKFTFASDSETSSPELNGYTLRASVRPFNQTVSNLVINEEGEFVISGSLDMDCILDEYKDTDKAFYSISLQTNGLTDLKYLTIQYKLDDAVSYTTMDELCTDSPTQIIYFPADTIAKIMYLRFTLSSPTDTSLVSYAVTGVLRPPARKVVDCTLYIADKYKGHT